MASIPPCVQPGVFITVAPWLNNPSMSFGGKTVTLTTTGPNPGILVKQGRKTPLFHQQLANRILKYMVLGNTFLLILDIEVDLGTSTRRMSLVNFTTSSLSEVSILTVLANSDQVFLPVVNPSQMNQCVFLAYGQDGIQHTDVAIYSSDNGRVLCNSVGTFIPTGQTLGEATTSQLIIHYNTNNISQTQFCPP